MIAIINDWQTWLAFERLCAGAYSVERICTLSPGIEEYLKGRFEIQQISAPSTAETNALGEKMIELALKWRVKLDALYGSDYDGLPIGTLLGPSLPLLLTTFCYHWLALQRARDGVGRKLLVPYLPSQPQNDFEASSPRNLVPQGMNYLALLARELEEDDVTALPLSSVDLNNPTFWPSVSKNQPLLRDRMLDFGLMRLAVRNHFIEFRLLKYLAGSGWLARAWRRICRSEPLVITMRSNGNFLRCLRRMMALRWPILTLNPPAADAGISGNTKSSGRFTHAIARDLDSLPAGWEALAVPLRAAAKRLDAYLSGFLLGYHRKASAEMRGWLEKNVGGRRAVLLTNGLYQPTDNLIGQYCHNFGVRVVGFQHGASGLLAQYKDRLRFSDMKRADTFICFTPYERDFFRSLNEAGARQFLVAGTRGVQDARSTAASRLLARRRWRASRKRPLLIYAPTQFKDGHIWLPHALQDMDYWRFVRRMVFDVLGQLESFDCLVKYHRKGLTSGMASPRARRRLEPLEMTEMPDNVRTEYWPDLRYTRFAADVIIVDRATSTLGWVLYAGTPVVYVDMDIEPLLPEPRAAIQGGLFYIDAAEPDWPVRLRDLLSRPLNELKEMWAEKAAARVRLCEHYVLGPKVSNADIARAIGEVCAEGVPAP